MSHVHELENEDQRKRIAEIEIRVLALEEAVNRMTNMDPLNLHSLDGMLRALGRRTINGRPQGSYLNERLRHYEWALLNVKALGLELAQRLGASRFAVAPASPPNTQLAWKLCTQKDIESDWFSYWCSEIRCAPIYHRKLWEACYIAQACYAEGMLKDGKHGLAFGCGREPLPSLFAKYGANVLATDLPAEDAGSAGWAETHQHAASIEIVRQPSICPDPVARQRVQFRAVDMTAIPEDLYGKFDFCWSACSLEHLGSIAKGLEFVEHSLRCLKPGGIAVHTTEYNLGEWSEQIDNWGAVFYQKQNILEFANKLASQGYLIKLQPDLSPGDGLLDGYVDIQPWGDDAREMSRLKEPQPHLKYCFDGFACTSIGLIIVKP